MTAPPASRKVGMVLAGLAALIAVARLRTYDEPLETDIMCYTVVARELLNGKYLYSEVWDIKPPGVFMAYAAALLLARDDATLAVYLLNVVAAVLTLTGIFAAARAVAGAGIGLLAAAAWAIVSGDLRLQANQPNTEVFMNAAHIWALALLLGGVRQSGEPHTDWRGWPVRSAAAGLLLGLGAIFKHVSFALVPPLAVALWFAAARTHGHGRAAALAILFAGLSVWAWIVSTVWFAVTGRWFDFSATLFGYSLFYTSLDAGGLMGNLTAGLSRLAVFSTDMLAVLPLALSALAGLAAWAASGQTAQPAGWRFLALLAASGTGTGLAVVLPGRFYPHYYQLWLPFLCVSGAVAVAALGRAAPTMPLARPRVVGSILLLALVATQAPAYRLSALEWSWHKYGPDFANDKALGLRIRPLLEPGETLFVWGQYGGLYVYSGARPATGFFFLVPILWTPHADIYAARALEDLRRAPPAMILEDCRDVPPYPNHPIVRWIHSVYMPLPLGTLEQSRYRIWCLRSGALARRLSLEQSDAP